MHDSNKAMELGAWVGRSQAFAMISSHCSAAQAECLKRIRDSESYKTLGLTWDEFCRDHIRLARPRVDVLIRSLEEYGAAYYQLSEIIRVSPETYRQISPSIHGESIEIDGELVALTAENAPRIRSAVKRMRDDLKKARQTASRGFNVLFPKLHMDALLEELHDVCRRKLSTSDLNDLVDLLDFSLDRLSSLRDGLDNGPQA